MPLATAHQHRDHSGLDNSPITGRKLWCSHYLKNLGPGFILTNFREVNGTHYCPSTQRSLRSGQFPNYWKKALVQPLLKILSNFRPVSNLMFISKLTEKAVFDQTNNHINKTSSFLTLQSSHRRHRGPETALLKVNSDILLNKNRGHATLLVLLRASFDTILS